MHPAVAALIVTLLWALVAGALAYLGRERVRAATPIAPQRAQEGIKEDLQAAKEGLRAGRAGELKTTGGTYR
jgi:Putative Actinobacterial Holin-X, holin superfamily III